ncbi:hypothetical protein FLL45_20035 [Aliikangiella marina]|uniref:Uncharacterized protein n=1 Tax=Aliikangiella marina TaxID=1712262 RepID=A0A545T2K2_9GAMM|nr:hypothetical protein [Aliikangiella marina]TQV71447.1 hypothetical protein FLL45_20035 [Aliikangiella marina]
MSDFKLKPLSKIESEDGVVYEFNPIYSWFLILCIILLVVSFILQNESFSVFVYSVFFIYFGLKVTLGSQYSREIRLAIKAKNAEIKGNRYSFSEPMSIVVKTHLNDEDKPEEVDQGRD